MNIHEYQAKEILKNFGVKIQNGFVAETPKDAKTLAENGAQLAFSYQNEGFKKRLIPLMSTVKSCWGERKRSNQRNWIKRWGNIYVIR